MKINEVETAVGISKKNIRFYEEEGLLSPAREPGNGYRNYSAEDVERLRRIKLLRKLDVPLSEIRRMLSDECTLSEGMERQLLGLEKHRRYLDEAMEFCEVLRQEEGSLNTLDVEQVLQRLGQREKQGVVFVNIERTDRRKERYKGAVVGAAIFITMMLSVMGIVTWQLLVQAPWEKIPVWGLFLLYGVPLGCIVATLTVLAERIQHIGKGEEDDYRNY